MTTWQKSRARAAPWFLLPAFVVLGLFVVWPLLRAAIWSFSTADLLAVGDKRWVGLANYSSLLSDVRFRQAFGNTALFALLVVPLQVAIAFLLALWVNRPNPAWRWLRSVFFIPVIVSMPVLAVLWSMFYQPEQGTEMGLINAVLKLLHLRTHAWLHEPEWALPALAFMSLWQGVGLQMMVFLAGLQSVPSELLEVARIDGANAIQRVIHVILPELRTTLIFVFTVTTILAFRLFVQPYLMTHGGPANRTRSLIQLIYETTFLDQELGRACAGAFLFLVLVGFVTVLQRFFAKEERT